MTGLEPTRTEQAAAPALAASVSVPERLGYRVIIPQPKGHLALANPRYELLPSDAKTR